MEKKSAAALTARVTIDDVVSMYYVVMVRTMSKMIMSDRVFVNEKDARRYCQINNLAKDNPRGYFYVEKCLPGKSILGKTV